MSSRGDIAWSRRPQCGVGLVETMVALVIGLFLIGSALTVYERCRSAYRGVEAVSRLQETARYALDVIERDVRMAGYWGLSSRPALVLNRAGPDQALPDDLAGARVAIESCGANWAIHLDEYLGGWNGSVGYPLECAAYQDEYRAGTDGLVIRRAAEGAAVTLLGGRLYVQSGYLQGRLFIADPGCTNPDDPACIPPDHWPPTSETRDLMAMAYYVSAVSVGRGDVPALRRKRLVSGAILDEEVASGVEDLQIRFGIDADGDDTADAYVDPAADPATLGGRIVAATIWLRVRSENAEPGFTDNRAYVYADVDDAAPGDRFRRIVVSRTVSLRNGRG